MKIVDKPNLDGNLVMRLKSHVYDIVGCCQEVHKELGPWLNEYVYQEALKVALEEKQIPFEKVLQKRHTSFSRFFGFQVVALQGLMVWMEAFIWVLAHKGKHAATTAET